MTDLFMSLFIMPKIFMFFVHIAKYVTYFVFALIVCFTSNNFTQQFKDEPIYIRGGIYAFEQLRYNLRIVIGTIIPIDPNLYSGIDKEEKELLPEVSKAGFSFSEHQKLSLKLLTFQVKELEHKALQIYFTSKQFIKQSKLNNIKVTDVAN